MDKFPGDAAKIIDQSESFLLWGGEFGRSSRVRTLTADDQGHQKHQENYL